MSHRYDDEMETIKGQEVDDNDGMMMSFAKNAGSHTDHIGKGM